MRRFTNMSVTFYCVLNSVWQKESQLQVREKEYRRARL